MSIRETLYNNKRINKKIRSILERFFFKIFKLGTYFGIQILPVHYYSPLPNIVELKRTINLWAKKSKMPGVSINIDKQTKKMYEICMKYQKEYLGNKNYKEAVLKHFGPGYGYIESQALHSVIRSYKPKKIIEVGSGISTYCILKALELNKQEGKNGEITCIEPYPSEKLKMLKEVRLIVQKVQAVSPEAFEGLGKGDLLFIDSSHTVKPGSDVNYLILEVLPRLKKGVIVHVHDIYFPYDYQYSVFNTLFHWTETSLLRGFLIFNKKADIIFSMSHLHHERKDDLKKIFPEYNPSIDSNGLCNYSQQPHENPDKHFPTSIYIEIR